MPNCQSENFKIKRGCEILDEFNCDLYGRLVLIRVCNDDIDKFKKVIDAFNLTLSAAAPARKSSITNAMRDAILALCAYGRPMKAAKMLIRKAAAENPGADVEMLIRKALKYSYAKKSKGGGE